MFVKWVTLTAYSAAYAARSGLVPYAKSVCWPIIFSHTIKSFSVNDTLPIADFYCGNHVNAVGIGRLGRRKAIRPDANIFVPGRKNCGSQNVTASNRQTMGLPKEF